MYSMYRHSILRITLPPMRHKKDRDNRDNKYKTNIGALYCTVQYNDGFKITAHEIKLIFEDWDAV